jgi:hypothetical protein
MSTAVNKSNSTALTNLYPRIQQAGKMPAVMVSAEMSRKWR